MKKVLLVAYKHLYIHPRRSRFGKLVTDMLTLPIIMLGIDWKEIFRFAAYCKDHGYRHTLLDAFISFFKYGSSIKQFYIYRFYEKSERERAKWITEKVMNSFIHFMDPPKYNRLVHDKIKAFELLGEFMRRDILVLEDESDLEKAIQWIAAKREFVIKPRFGGCGKGVEFVEYTDGTNMRRFLTNKLRSGPQIIEEVIEQHPVMNLLYPDSVNTIRIQTVLKDNDVLILGAQLRIGNGGRVDNMSAGGLAAAVDLNSGKVISNGFFHDITKTNGLSSHPLSGHIIRGFIVPYWEEAISLVKNMARKIPMFKTIGWDIAITPDGPILVEFNREWMTGTFQIPYERGRLDVLLPYMDKRYLYPVQKRYVCFGGNLMPTSDNL